MSDKGTQTLLQGNEAIAEGAIAAGMRFYAGYPITPSSEIAETLSRRLPQVGGTFVQMEDEIASVGAIIGASLTGTKSMTATSGPGFSLMQENLGLAIMLEVPCVLVNVQRQGPSSGLPTRPAQADLMQVRWGTHGTHSIVCLAPSSVRECFDLTVKAFNIAEKLRTPVAILSDAVIAHMRENVTLPGPGEAEIVNRKRPTVGPGEYLPFKPDDDLIPPMALFGDGYRYHMTGMTHSEKGYPTNDTTIAGKLTRRLVEKIDLHAPEVTFYEGEWLEDAKVVVVCFGCVSRAAWDAVQEMRKQGRKVGLLKLVTLWPFPKDVILHVAETAEALLVPELSMGDLASEIDRVVKDRIPVHSMPRVDGLNFTPGEIAARLKEML